MHGKLFHANNIRWAAQIPSWSASNVSLVFHGVNEPKQVIKTFSVLTVLITLLDHGKSSVEGNLSTLRGWFLCHLDPEELLWAPSLRQWKFDRWLVPNDKTCVVLLFPVPVFKMAVRWFCWSTGLVSEWSIRAVCKPEMASKESLGRVRHFNLISQQVGVIFGHWIFYFLLQWMLCTNSLPIGRAYEIYFTPHILRLDRITF